MQSKQILGSLSYTGPRVTVKAEMPRATRRFLSDLLEGKLSWAPAHGDNLRFIGEGRFGYYAFANGMVKEYIEYGNY